MSIFNFLLAELTNLSSWIDSKLHKDRAKCLFYPMTATPLLSSIGVCNQPLLNTAEGWDGGMEDYVPGTAKEPLGEITCAGWEEGGHNTYTAASENSGPTAKHLGFHWPQPQSWCWACEVLPSLSSSFSFSGCAGSVDINSSQGYQLNRVWLSSKAKVEARAHQKRGCHLRRTSLNVSYSSNTYSIAQWLNGDPGPSMPGFKAPSTFRVSYSTSTYFSTSYNNSIYLCRVAELAEGINTWKVLRIVLTLVIAECPLTTFYFSFLKHMSWKQ